MKSTLNTAIGCLFTCCLMFSHSAKAQPGNGNGNGNGNSGGVNNTWKLTGNNGINNTNYLGTSDNADLIFKTNSVERMRMLGSGNIGVGTSNPLYTLDINGTINAQQLLVNGNPLPYLPLTGGTLTGNLMLQGATGIGHSGSNAFMAFEVAGFPNVIGIGQDQTPGVGQGLAMIPASAAPTLAPNNPDGGVFVIDNNSSGTIRLQVGTNPNLGSGLVINGKFGTGGNTGTVELKNALGDRLTLDGINGPSLLHTTRGVQADGLFAYTSDFSANYTDRSLVDKGYVDSRGSTALPYDELYVNDYIKVGDNSMYIASPNVVIQGFGFNYTTTRHEIFTDDDHLLIQSNPISNSYHTILNAGGNTGTVGIGVNIPDQSSKLHVDGLVRMDGRIYAANGGGSTDVFSITGNTSTSNGPFIEMFGDAVPSRENELALGSNGNTSFFTYDGGNGFVRRMTIANYGAIGIGTNTPPGQSRLYIRSLNAAGQNASEPLIVEQNETGPFAYGIRTLVNNTYTKALAVEKGGDEHFVVYGDGYVFCRELKITAGAFVHPDYVFEEDYELMPLNELRNYIHQHKHLPNVTSAAEVEANGGVQVGEMQQELLEKVEELTLYILELEERLNELESKE